MNTNNEGYDPAELEADGYDRISIGCAALASVAIVAITLRMIDASPAELVRMWLEWMNS